MPHANRTRLCTLLASAVLLAGFLACSTGCLSVLPSSQKQAAEVKAGITNAINEVAEVRNTLTTQVNNVQNDAKMWVIALFVVVIVGAAFPVLLLVLLAWLVKRWLAAQTCELRAGKQP